MIKITLTESSNYFDIKVIGHSGMKGNSIICASVSILIESWRLTEAYLENRQINFKDGYLQAKVEKTTISHILFTQLYIGFKALQSRYPKEIYLNIGG